MSRFAELPVCMLCGVEVVIKDRIISVKGNLGSLVHYLHIVLDCKKIDNNLVLSFRSKTRLVNKKSLLGTTYALLRAMMIGVSVGFTKKLQLFGVGYRAAINNNIITLFVGYSHAVNYNIPDGVRVVCPSPLDIVLSSANKQLIGQVAADLRAVRPPEPFSGKGIRYEGEVIHIKDVKKK